MIIILKFPRGFMLRATNYLLSFFIFITEKGKENPWVMWRCPSIRLSSKIGGYHTPNLTRLLKYD